MNVPIDYETIQTLESVGEDLLRQGDERGTRLLVLVLLWRSRNYACNVDESAGIADIVDLNGYSRKVICE